MTLCIRLHDGAACGVAQVSHIRFAADRLLPASLSRVPSEDGVEKCAPTHNPHFRRRAAQRRPN
jgi:hypothetical protein